MIDGFTNEELESLYFTFKLLNGDSIVCQVLQDNDKSIVVRDPIMIHTHSAMTSEGIKAFIFYSEWFNGVESRVHMIRKDHILSAGIPDASLKAEYTRIVQSKHNKDTVKTKKTPQKKDWTGLDFDIKNPNDRFGSN